MTPQDICHRDAETFTKLVQKLYPWAQPVVVYHSEVVRLWGENYTSWGEVPEDFMPPPSNHFSPQRARRVFNCWAQVTCGQVPGVMFQFLHRERDEETRWYFRSNHTVLATRHRKTGSMTYPLISLGTRANPKFGATFWNTAQRYILTTCSKQALNDLYEEMGYNVSKKTKKAKGLKSWDHGTIRASFLGCPLVGAHL